LARLQSFNNNMEKTSKRIGNIIKYGIKNNNGIEIIKPNYDRIEDISGISSGYVFAVQLNEKWGVIDENECWIIQPKYDYILQIDKFDHEYLSVKLNEKWGVIDYEDNEICPIIYDQILTENALENDIYGAHFVVKINDKWGIIDTKSNWLYEPYFDKITINDYFTISKKEITVELNGTSQELNIDEIYQELLDYSDEYSGMKFQINNEIKITASNNNEHIFKELDKLIGLDDVKKEIRDIYSYIKNQIIRKEKGLKTRPISYHMIFYGPPGTGKTTVARLIGEMFKELGILKMGHFIEADRSQLVAGYLGQTSIKVNNVVDNALDGILFIDEAYSLYSKQEDFFAKEAVNTLIKRIEDDRDRLIVILAGYKEQMETFIESNPGFKSRFNIHLNFKNYNKEELLEIFKQICFENDYKITPLVEDAILKIIENELNKNDESFSNARYIRNLFETIIKKQSRRLGNKNAPSIKDLESIELEDID